MIFKDIGSELELDQRTVSDYFDYLEQVKLIRKVRKFSPSKNKRKKYLVSKRSARYYPYFTSLHQYSSINNIEFGLKAKTEVAFQLKQSYYWNEKGLKEIDFIIEDNGRLIGYDVKMKNSIRTKNIKWLLKADFLDQKVLITKHPTSIPMNILERIHCISFDQLDQIGQKDNKN